MAKRTSNIKSNSATRGKLNRIGETVKQETTQLPDAIQVPKQSNVKVTFLHVGNDVSLAELMVKSVKKAMQGVEVIQLTDMVTPQIKGVSSVVRKPYSGYLMTFRLEHLADLNGEWITLDTDVIVNKDLREVFNQDFDVALTRRYQPIIDENGINIVDSMPYNTGVMFSRNKIFWKNAHKLLLNMPESAHRWWGDQLSVSQASKSKHFNVLELDCNKYNYTPLNDKDKQDVFVYHFKGNRKDWMKNGDY